MAQVHLERRTHGVESARKVIQRVLDDEAADAYLKAKLVTENVILTWKCQRDIPAARRQFSESAASCLDSRYFWINYLAFEIETATYGIFPVSCFWNHRLTNRRGSDCRAYTRC